MIVYTYSKEKKEFISTHECQAHPLRENEFLYPEFYTIVKPQKTTKFQTNVWNGKSWDTIPDYRGEFFFQNNKVINITESGITPAGIQLTQEDINKINSEEFEYKEVNGVLIFTEIVTTEKEIFSLKQYLSNTYHYVMEQVEFGTEMPSEIKQKRSEAYARIKELENA